MSIEKIISALPRKSNEERDRFRRNANDILTGRRPGNKDDAAQMIAALDAIQRSEHRDRYEHLKGAPVARRVVETFQADPATETEAKVIRVLLANPGASSAALSDALGWGGQIWHTHFGTMCKNREAWLWPAERSVMRDANFWSGILADFDMATSTWTIKPDVAEAFGELGLAPGKAA